MQVKLNGKLVLPDGVRLARRYEIPGPEAVRSASFERVQTANLVRGFTLEKSDDPRFRYYAEANIDAPQVWNVFCELSEALLGPESSLLFSEIDDDPVDLGSCATDEMIALLEPHRYQLSHEGYIQFGLLDDQEDKITEIFVAPTKHFRIWFGDLDRFSAVLRKFEIAEADELEFLDEYARTTKPLKTGVLFDEFHLLVEHFENEIAKRCPKQKPDNET